MADGPEREAELDPDTVGDERDERKAKALERIADALELHNRLLIQRVQEEAGIIPVPE